MRDYSHLPLDDFLTTVANAEEGLGNDINAAEYRRRAKEARQLALDASNATGEVIRLKDTLNRLQAEITRAA